jgi:hypothetical protein
VSAPFAGIADLGFTAQYRPQAASEKQRDIPFLIEGPERPLTRLTEFLRMLGASKMEAYGWSEPVALSDEVVVLAFRDRSLGEDDKMVMVAGELSRYVYNLVRPVVFTFLSDCVSVAELRLSEEIEMNVKAKGAAQWQVVMARSEIVPTNGNRLLWQLAG